jgi:hypothetical protein
MGDRVRVKIDGTPQLAAEVLPDALGQLHLGTGVEVSATLEPSAVTAYSSLADQRR